MRRVLLLATVLTAFVLVGVASAAKPGVVKIALARPAVVYGSSVQLSGSVSNHQAGGVVFVLGRPSGTQAFNQLDMATTTAKGVWSYTASPSIQTSYQARWGAVTSAIVTVKVRPKITLALESRTATRGTFSVQVEGNRPFTGKRVLIQRITASGPATVKRRQAHGELLGDVHHPAPEPWCPGSGRDVDLAGCARLHRRLQQRLEKLVTRRPGRRLPGPASNFSLDRASPETVTGARAVRQPS